MTARRWTSWLLAVVLMVPCMLAAERSEDADDFTAYVEQVREWGMTEVARMNIRMIAAIVAETTLLSFQKDEASGAWWPRYSSSFCPSPDMSEIERKQLEDKQEAKIVPLLARIQPLADMDKSGFVTTEEGMQFRWIVEFGYRASHVVNEEGHDIERICSGLSMEAEQVREKAKQYNELLEEAQAAGIDLPKLEL